MTTTGLKRIFAALSIAIVGQVALQAQSLSAPAGYEYVDSLVYRAAESYDTTLDGQSVFDYVADVNISQSQNIRSGMARHIQNNATKELHGYRVRIYFDNKQDSRSRSSEAERTFSVRYPGHRTYRSFANPFFKVTVGDFRTKSEALELLQRVKNDFPTAVVVKEPISYPVVDKLSSYTIDTVRVLRPICSSRD